MTEVDVPGPDDLVEAEVFYLLAHLDDSRHDDGPEEAEYRRKLERLWDLDPQEGMTR